MSDQFTFDELNLWNWNQSVSLKSYKNPNFTMSDASKSHPQYQYQTLGNQEQPWNLEEFNKKADKKLKNRTNVKNFRQRKKYQQQRILQKLKLLEHENEILRKEKFCKKCKTPFGGIIQVTQTTIQNEKQKNQQNSNFLQNGNRQQGFEFQKPIFFTKKQQQIPNRNGKIWIALGILLMVIGVHLYGFRGKQGYQDISISKIQSQKIIDMYQNKKADLGDYFDVKVKYKGKANPKQTQKQYDIFRQIRVFHEQQKQQKTRKYQTMAHQTFQNYQMHEQKNQKNFKSHQFDHENEGEVRFHKNLLYAIQAQIDEVGQYI